MQEQLCCLLAPPKPLVIVSSFTGGVTKISTLKLQATAVRAVELSNKLEARAGVSSPCIPVTHALL